MFLIVDPQFDEWACGTHTYEKQWIFSFTDHMRRSVIVNDFYWSGTLILVFLGGWGWNNHVNIT